jgi:hypothetical protein
VATMLDANILIVFYEKVIKVKADVAAFPNSFLRVIIFTLARRYIG